ncbi:MAG: hypothetical protein J5563_06025 [Clostridia bacterium]|nr:hypothetical protein [Clostridia bacterium]
MSSKLKFDGKEYTKLYPADERRAYRNQCMCAATGILFFIPLVSCPDSQYGKFWANQGAVTLTVELLCLIAGLIFKGICWLLALIPVVGIVFDVLYVIILIALWAVAIFYIFYGMRYAHKCRAKNLPFIGTIRYIR